MNHITQCYICTKPFWSPYYGGTTMCRECQAQVAETVQRLFPGWTVSQINLTLKRPGEQRTLHMEK